MDTLRRCRRRYDPWIEQVPLRLPTARSWPRIREHGAEILIVESDFVHAPVFDWTCE
jgi:hypothetical protein